MTRRDPAVSVTFGRGEDSPTYVTGPAGSFLVAHNGSDYSLFTWTEAAGAGAEVGTGEYPKLLERAKKWARLARLAPSWDAQAARENDPRRLT